MRFHRGKAKLSELANSAGASKPPQSNPISRGQRKLPRIMKSHGGKADLSELANLTGTSTSLQSN